MFGSCFCFFIAAPCIDQKLFSVNLCLTHWPLRRMQKWPPKHLHGGISFLATLTRLPALKYCLEPRINILQTKSGWVWLWQNWGSYCVVGFLGVLVGFGFCLVVLVCCLAIFVCLELICCTHYPNGHQVGPKAVSRIRHVEIPHLPAVARTCYPCDVRRCRLRWWLSALLPPFCNLFLGLLLSDFSIYIWHSYSSFWRPAWA